MRSPAAPPAYDEAVPKKPMRNRVFREEDAHYLAAQMEAEVTDNGDLSDNLRAFVRKFGRRHLPAARAALLELEANAPPGKPPTRQQVQDFLEQYGTEWEGEH